MYAAVVFGWGVVQNFFTNVFFCSMEGRRGARMRKKGYLLAACVVAAVLIGALIIPNFYDRSDGSKGRHSEAPSAVLIKSRRNAPVAGSSIEINSVEVPAGSYEQVLKRLEGAAQEGNAEAAFGIYLKANECFQAMSNQLSDDEMKAYASAGIGPERLEEAISKQLADCHGITKESLSNRGDWLAAAARNGSIQARLLFATDSEAIVGNATDMIRDPQRITKYKREAVTYLAESASAGSIDAMMRLGEIYDDGILAPKNDVSSYAYYKAAQAKVPGTRLGSLDRLRSTMSASEVHAGEEQASVILNDCCSH
ncbi:hypothetical protein [Xanthomonas euvesicatoria]|uniref:hypothetical protein n=1 Tax=Xanthomonas euvesicatoria TaxID=456327 RepID=UPI003558AC8B